MTDDLLLTFYGDDFTGATDALESLSLGGVRSVLFLAPPTLAQLSGRFAGMQAVGLAGMSRTMTPQELDRELPPAFAALKALNAPLTHYKVCSTFDSSPEVGSIGRAIEIGQDVFASAYIPVAVGVPALKRFTVFGNHFGASGDAIYRLDRHPTMSQHPVTPMHESDLRLHLARQTNLPIGLIDVRDLTEPVNQIQQKIDALVQSGIRIVIFDTLTDDHLQTVGQILWEQGQIAPASFVVGSSGVGYALSSIWRQQRLTLEPAFPVPDPVDQIVVMSGSASPLTEAQITYALERGFAGIRLDLPALVDREQAPATHERLVHHALTVLKEGRSVILYTALGPDDPAIEATRQMIASLGHHSKEAGKLIGMAQGHLLKSILDQVALKRICVAGGDTCGYVLGQLGIYALEVVSSIDPGAPLCRAGATNPRLDGMEIALKGGQLGAENYFRRLMG